MGKLDKKVFLGFGTGAGMGRATAELFAREGAKVVICDLSDSDGPQVADSIKASGGEAIFVPTNCTVDEQVEAAAAAAIKHYGSIDIMLYQPGMGYACSLLEADINDWKTVYNINVFGVVRAIKYVGKYMKEQKKGSIIVTSSMSSFVPTLENAGYCSSKAAVDQLIQVACMELSPEIRVNSINPGLTNTRSIAILSGNKAATERVMKNIPLKRYGEPEDFAKTALFLASDDSSYITGANIVMDGGIHCYGFSSAPYDVMGTPEIVSTEGK